VRKLCRWQDNSIWREEETAYPLDHKKVKRAMPHVKAIARRAHALQDKISENRRELRELEAIADGIKDATGVRFVNSLELAKARLETVGIVAEAYGDSKSKVNAEAGKTGGCFRRLKERWVHKGAFVLEFKKALHKVGFTKAQAFPHAKEGDPSERINELLNREREHMIEEERDLIIMYFYNGNDYRASTDHLVRAALLFFLPQFANVKASRKEFDRITDTLMRGELAALRMAQDVFSKRKEKGRQTYLLVIMPLQFQNHIKMPYFSLGKNGKADQYIFTLPARRFFLERVQWIGEVVTGGTYLATKTALEKFSEELEQLPPEGRIPVSTVLTNTLPRQKEYSDGTPHFSLLGHQVILKEILRVLVVIAEDGSRRETLADMLNRINDEEHFVKTSQEYCCRNTRDTYETRKGTHPCFVVEASSIFASGKFPTGSDECMEGVCAMSLSSILWAVVVILVVLWLLGFLVGHIGPFIHILLVIAVIVLLYNLFVGMRRRV
jgi:hypothetical protein